MNFLRHGFTAVCVAASVIAAAAQRPPSIRTADGLLLGFNAAGQLSRVQSAEVSVRLAGEPALFRIRDAPEKSAFIVVPMTVTEDNGALAIRSRNDPLDLTLSASITAHGDFLQLDGEVSTRRQTDRCIDLKIQLPIDPSGFIVGTGLYDGPPPATNRRKAKKQSAEADIDVAGADDNAWYPVLPVSHRSSGVGLSLAVPPTHPTRFTTGMDEGGAYILFRIGLSPLSAKPGCTPFRVIVYRHDAAWGFRAALARYYAFYREGFFTRPARRIGAWTTQNPSKLAHPELYAYHEAGFASWRHPAGTDSGINVKPTLELLDEGPAARTLADYEQLCELAVDEKLGLYSLPYTIVGQRQLLHLPELPKTFADAMRVLDTWSPREPIPFDGPPQALSFRSPDELKAIIRNSTLHDPQGRLALLPRAYRGPTLTFPQNPNPNLFRDEQRPTIARYTLDYYIPMMLTSRFVDGIYLDSLGRWCGYYNFRTEHFKDSTVPLTYQGSPPQVCLWNLQSHAEYMWEARRRLHAQGKILMANGLSPERVMLGFACDVMGREGAPSYESGEGFYAMRVAAGSKPYCLLNATHHVSPRLWASSLYMGYLMGCNSEPGLADEAKYLPIVIKCNEAGWQPVTHARATPAVVGVERWGGETADGALLFTVMNRAAKPVTAELVIDRVPLRRSPPVRVVDLLNRKAADIRPAGDQLVVTLQLGPEEASALEFTH